jgi:hypothetical protein
MRAIIVCILLVLAIPVLADTYAFGSRVLVSGDGPAKVMEIAGKPDRIVQLENKLGGVYGERWEYYLGGKTVSIILIDGKVTQINESR